ncbi:dual specificity protein phosphatase family protein [Sandaracinus amylolyticus]|uniref:phosphatase domain-containing protein n=1 Tax=Sandaracinus amylolyticus TaxID=927083 RepID=UPI001F01AD78|nr:dual specificity protein phosphatase family protein [Sandaracinus amylolyticus]UJR79765.1 Ser/Thr and Tyr protein phosphatase [Sandaracinus amylolyticus]
MRFGWFQVVLGLLLIGCAGWIGGPAWALTWPALAVIAVGLGYLGLGPGVFGKRDDGTLRTPHFVLLFPYHVVAWMRVKWDAWRRREDAWNEVAPGLYLGRIVGAEGLPPGTRVVVDLTSEFACGAAMRDGRDYHCLPALDTSVPRYSDFARLARAIAAHEGPVYVHCAAGHGRSATFAAALLIARGQAGDVDEAEAKLREARPTVHLHRGQRAMVQRFAEELRARATPSLATA